MFPALNPAAIRALKSFRSSKPWRGSAEERRTKFETLLDGLSTAYGLVRPELRLCLVNSGTAGNGVYSPEHNLIVLAGKLSVVTFLYCFGRAGGLDRDGALEWARDLFRRFFPRSHGGCRQVGDLLLKDQAMRN